MRSAWALVVLATAGWSGAEAAPYIDEAVQDQWFTGSLEAPSPALTKAGSIAVEPYAIYQGNTGAYDNNWGHYSVAHDLNQLQLVTEIQYGINDRLTLATTPLFAHSWNGQTTSSFIGVGDLPVELEYRVNEMDRKTGSPSMTFELGMNFPTGAYDRLRTSVDGLGSGAFTAKEGVLLQSLFDTWDNHPLRLRLYGAAFEPLADVSVHDVSVYGTSQGFRGYAAPGVSEELGLGVEYGLNQQWVLAFDVVQNYADGTHLTGANAAGNFVSTHSASSVSFALAPAVEYNFTSNVGLIAGAAFSAAGRM